MILISGHLVIDPANLDRATELVGELVAATRAEPGNIAYAFASTLGDPGRLVIHEQWRARPRSTPTTWRRPSGG